MLWRFVLLLTVVLGTISTFTVQQREAFRRSVCTLSKRSSPTFHDRVDWTTTTAVALACTVLIWIGCRIWLGDIHIKLTLPLDFNAKSLKSLLQVIHLYKSLSVELIRKRNPLKLFQSGRKTLAGTEISHLTSMNIDDEAENPTIYLKDRLVSECKMMEDSVFHSQRELILNLQDHLNTVNEQKKAMKQRLDLSLRYQKSCQRELEITKQQLATANSQLECMKQSLEEKTILMEAMQRDLTAAHYSRKTLIRQVELLKIELMSLKSIAMDAPKDDIFVEIPDCKTERGKLDLRRVRKTFKKLDRSITESLSKMKIHPASLTSLCKSDDEGSVFQEHSAEIYEVSVERLPVPAVLTPVERDVEWLVASIETESIRSLEPGNELESPLQDDDMHVQETPVSSTSDSDSVEEKPTNSSAISLIVDAILRYSGSSRASSSSETRRSPERNQEGHVSSDSDVEERETERFITGSPAFQKLMETFMTQTVN